MERLIAQDAVLRNVYLLNDVEDELNRDLAMSLFKPNEKFTFDVSSHLGALPKELTPTEFCDMLPEALSGFTGTVSSPTSMNISLGELTNGSNITCEAILCCPESPLVLTP